MRIYGRVLKVGEYFLFDPWSGVLEGYDLDGVRGTYTPKQPDPMGRLRCHQMGLSLGKAKGTVWRFEADWLRWWDAQGNVLPMPEEVVGIDAERADAEARRADAEAQRAERAEAELRALKAGTRT
jgi:hypothetical protein